MPDPVDEGDRVVAVSGRFRGSKGIVLLGPTKVQTPQGREILAIQFERPRAGSSWEFAHCFRRIEG
jgi:hypothetical protein